MALSNSLMSNPGKLNKRLDFYIRGEVDDGAGGQTDEDIFVFTKWGQLRPIEGRKFFECLNMQATLTHECIVRYNTKIKRSMIIKYAGREFEIEYVQNMNEANKYLMLRLTEVTYG